MAEAEPQKEFLDAVQKAQDDIADLIRRAEEYALRQPKFNRLENRYSQAQDRIGRWWQHPDPYKEAPRGRRAFERYASVYTRVSNKIEAFVQEVVATFQELGNKEWGPEGQARKVLSHADVELLEGEIRGPGHPGLGGTIGPACLALRHAEQMLDDLLRSSPSQPAAHPGHPTRAEPPTVRRAGIVSNGPPRSVERVQRKECLCGELASIKIHLEEGQTIDAVRKQYPDFEVWALLKKHGYESEILQPDFRPKALAGTLVRHIYGVTEETIRKDLQKVPRTPKH
jgi:hypothetical protein